MLKKKVQKVVLAVMLAVTLVSSIPVIGDALGWHVTPSAQALFLWSD